LCEILILKAIPIGLVDCPLIPIIFIFDDVSGSFPNLFKNLFEIRHPVAPVSITALTNWSFIDSLTVAISVVISGGWFPDSAFSSPVVNAFRRLNSRTGKLF
jgi:hypothetical protein